MGVGRYREIGFCFLRSVSWSMVLYIDMTVSELNHFLDIVLGSFLITVVLECDAVTCSLIKLVRHIELKIVQADVMTRFFLN